MADGRSMLDNIIAGKTVLGNDNPFLGPMPFAEDPHIRMITGAALDLAARIIGDLSDETRELDFTNFARKLAHYANRGGTLAEHPSFLTRVSFAAAYARRKPHLMRSTTAIATLATMAIQNNTARQRPRAHQRLPDSEIIEMEAKVAPPAPPIVWKSPDGHYQLVQFTHPFHVWEEGVVLNNCLCRLNPWLRQTRIDTTAPADALWSLGYWRDIDQGLLFIFSLRSGTTRIALLGIRDRVLDEFTVHFPNEPDLAQTLLRAIDFLDTRFSPLGLVTTNLPGTAQHLIRQVKQLRAARAPKRRPSR